MSPIYILARRSRTVWCWVAACAASLLLSGCTGTSAPSVRSFGASSASDQQSHKQAEIELGKQLFFDARLSLDGTLSCASCHDPALGFSDGLPLAAGFKGKILGRHTPHLYNLASRHSFFWDGRAESLEAQALEPIRNPDEMNLPLDELERRLAGISGYAAAFRNVYPDAGVTAANVARAIAAFERTIVAADTPFDRHQNGSKDAMADSARRGMQLFMGKALCSRCHIEPDFTDDKFHNTGVPGSDVGRARLDRVGDFTTKPYPFFQTQKAFKTPGLRNVALTAPYMHNGSEATLEDVVRFYNQGGKEPGSYGLSLNVRPLKLSEQELADLVEFLKSLTSPVTIAPPALPQ